ncbi:acyltransferase [Plantactinospora mayteni]|uniref:Acyltransferase n=1 Tax=Plantactinospora mayteni TaxID=566021 RepID=A0ABQ4EGL9_9ACTN|nr:acyltransferase [Plantactinospora mayteni]GIG93880.1 acyltransferase [Plantactinospora mayteni]
MTVTDRRADGEGHRPAAGQGREANCFDFLRLMAALCVVVQHAVAHLDTSFLWYRADNGLWFGDGVAMFFVISGAMVYASAERCHQDGRPWRDYLRNRLLRIAPALYVYTAVALLFLLTAGIVSFSALADPHVLAWLASGLLFMPVYHPAAFQGFGVGVLNGSLWTIPAEVSYYLVVPGLVLLAARRSFGTMMLLTATIGTMGAALYGLAGGSGSESLLAKLLAASLLPWLGFFLLGMWWRRVWHRVPQSGALAVVALVLYLGCAMWRHSVGPGMGVAVALIAGLPLSYLVFWVGHRGPRVLRRATDRLGDLSFGTYIWHMPVVNLLIWLGAIEGPLRGTPLILLVIALTIVCALFSWHFVEKPALRLKRYSSRPDSFGGPGRADYLHGPNANRLPLVRSGTRTRVRIDGGRRRLR